ncbi:enoyl-CoA hydratase-related protein [Pseudohalioglobus lutimaris]|uniref:1,4-dihydroxy-6-naphthoate synthase n=1 Tax=Pseudohalioglobus lutimaris TaxID=1737061 RepID=A0A2N5X3V6_9GAMM|nr:enoyl-CoA hydratase-related protein [Pseudohalioglobus lutimaris]PLW69174.1 1,4-dihydroxy-6-naphthoate synthase [Pseudohalioglobus lutimaris]
MAWTEWNTVDGDGLDNFELIAYEKKMHTELGGGIARVSLNTPEKMNTLTTDTVDEMFRAFYDANHDPMIGVIVIAARGKHFGAGGDVDWERWGLREAFYNRYPHNRLMRMSRKPIIAQVQGYCIAGHNHMAYCCDFTIAADNAIFGQAGPKVSSPADGFFVPYLTKVVGAKKAREMWMLCRKYPAAEALQMGLVNTVVAPEDLEAEVDQWCEEMLAKSPGCLEVLKASFDQEMDGYKESCVTSASMYPGWFDMPEGKEGGEAFVNKRPPNFWAIRKREAEMREQLLAEYDAELEKTRE